MPSVEQLIEQLRHCVARGAGLLRRVDSRRFEQLLSALRRAVDEDRASGERAVNELVRTQVAQGLAPAFLERRHPFQDSEALTRLMQAEWLHRASFIQKSPSLLAFYRRLVRALDAEPTCILEIGVKGGGSTSFWKAAFPKATVVGLDIKIPPGLMSGLSSDAVVYVEGHQADVRTLRRIADRHGPFTLVIDDGSHVGSDQAVSLRTLLPRVAPGGYYVIEDIQTTVKPSSTREIDYGEDLWIDFTLAVLQRLRRGPLPPDSPGSELGRDLVRYITDLVIAHQVLAIRARTAQTWTERPDLSPGIAPQGG
jgi:cephalosporin hydroxylase